MLNNNAVLLLEVYRVQSKEVDHNRWKNVPNLLKTIKLTHFKGMHCTLKRKQCMFKNSFCFIYFNKFGTFINILLLWSTSLLLTLCYWRKHCCHQSYPTHIRILGFGSDEISPLKFTPTLLLLLVFLLCLYLTRMRAVGQVSCCPYDSNKSSSYSCCWTSRTQSFRLQSVCSRRIMRDIGLIISTLSGFTFLVTSSKGANMLYRSWMMKHQCG